MLNHVCLMGRLTADPELKQTQSGVNVLSCCIAVDRDYDREQTDFINLVAWRQSAEFAARYFKKGQLIAAEGAIRTRNYEDREGKRRTAFEVVVNQFHFAEGKRGGHEQVPGPGDSDVPPEPPSGGALTLRSNSASSAEITGNSRPTDRTHLDLSMDFDDYEDLEAPEF